MIQNKNLIYGLVVISGFILVWLVYADQGIEPKPDIFSEESPLILIDGRMGAEHYQQYTFIAPSLAKYEKTWYCLLYTSPSPRDS